MSSTQPLLQPYRMRDLALANRVVMAPMTRSRARNRELLPTELHAQYYAQRASAGLIISEGVWISPDAVGWHDVPGLFTDEQVAHWKPVTDAVHNAGGVIFAQLWHTGSASHPDFFEGRAPLAPSAVNPGLRAPTATGRKPTVQPLAMSEHDIRRTITDFATAADNALAAGFDGVQLQAGFNYLISQFLNPRTNVRTDDYGGPIENRARFLFEIIEAVGKAVDLRRVGVKAGPAWSERGEFVAGADALADSEYVIGRLNDYDLSHLLLMGMMADPTGGPLQELAGDEMFRHFRKIYQGTVIANVEIDQDRGNALLGADLVDLVAYGQAFIANPDLPARLASHAPLVRPKPELFYGPDAAGYTDYAPLRG
ncbi:alkene reductase [Streptomyces sp. MMG1121]|uniref:alkene reductase n=1 Tax=Streptomyces sp. MMG1121 TaxID=1415544 RepID=UPI0006AD8E48|nr:alkene reductase [Streptomyces sp. MMG1121]KOV57956.1 NADH:flavin oxidoreductase [Streptomyces sp. MMG1121]